MSHPSSSPAKVAKRTPASSPASDAAAGAGAASAAASHEIIALDEDGMSDDTGDGPAANGKAPAASSSSSSTAASSSQQSAHISLVPAFTSATFDYVDRASINKYLLCSFCSAPFFQPLEHTCRMAFCTRCVSCPSSVSCPECNEAVVAGKNTQACSKITERQLEELQISCKDCNTKMTRKEYEAHWRDACPVACPFAAAGCKAAHPRSALNAHIDSCSFAPVQCEASAFGCTWAGQREAQSAHGKDCAWVACIPSFQALQRAHAKATEELTEENKRLRIALATREGQLKSYQAMHKGTASAAPRDSPRLSTGPMAMAPTAPDAPLFPLGTVLDALDTESQWMLAKVIKVDVSRKLYRITYLDWDASWDEWLSFTSPRLALAHTHTTAEDYEKHLQKSSRGELCGTTTASSAAAAAAAATPAATQGVTGKRKSSGRA